MHGPQLCLPFLVSSIDQFLFQIYTGTNSQLFLCYIDDYIGAASFTCAEIYHELPPCIQIHLDLGHPSPLYCSVSITGDKLLIDVFFKLTNFCSYLYYTSSPLASCKEAIHNSISQSLPHAPKVRLSILEHLTCRLSLANLTFLHL